MAVTVWSVPHEHQYEVSPLNMKKTVSSLTTCCYQFPDFWLVVNLLCILCSRIRNYRELLMIFFHDKQWYRPEPLFSVEEEDEDEDEEDEEEEKEVGEKVKETSGPSDGTELSEKTEVIAEAIHDPDATMSLEDIAPSAAPPARKAEYEFLLFNYLLRFVHREGQIGDFARAGLLFLIDVAMSPIDPISKSSTDENLDSSVSSSQSNLDTHADAALALAEYIVDGDFSTLR